jgi:signal peptidase I
MTANEQPAWYATATEFALERTSDRALVPVEAATRPPQRSLKSQPEETGVFRQVMESLACLAVAVIVFRAFLLEGYIISTGSMAPSLLGYHKQVVCPDCGFEFAFGVAFDRPSMAPSQLATCPNCGQGAIDVSNVPRNDGDQLLVNKYAYLFDGPHRWEVVVFLNPNNPNQAYVKRVVGLPGETIYVRDGDVYIDGRIQRKTLAEQRAIRIPVFDQNFRASQSDWVPHWLTDAEWSNQNAIFAFNDKLSRQRNADSNGTNGGVGPGQLSAATNASWVQYFHWPRLSPYSSQSSSGYSGSLRPGSITDNYGYNQPARISEQYRVNDLMLAARLAFRQPDTGQRVSHDDNGLARSIDATGEFVARLSCREKQVVCRIDADARRLDVWVVELSAKEADRVLADSRVADVSVPLLEEWFEQELEFELSSFDRQATVAVNGVELAVLPLDTDLRDVPDGSWSESPEGDLSKITVAGYATNSSLHAAESEPRVDDLAVNQAAWTGGVETRDVDFANGALHEETSFEESLSPVAFGARRGSVTVQSVTLYRDVHYTTENQRHATERPLALGDDEFFFLGDNSPVSLDSRGWVDPVVPRRLLVGRPLVVHLPSHPGRVKIGNTVKYIRVPDFSKIRCIR